MSTQQAADIKVLGQDLILSLLPKRVPNSHKGTYGHVLNIAGSTQFPGAAFLSSISSLKVGAGYCMLASCSDVDTSGSVADGANEVTNNAKEYVVSFAAADGTTLKAWCKAFKATAAAPAFMGPKGPKGPKHECNKGEKPECEKACEKAEPAK